MAGLEPGLSKLLLLHWKAGTNDSMATLGANGAIVDDGYARTHHLTVGSPIRLVTPTGRTVRLMVEAIYHPPQTENALGTVSISAHTFDSLYPNPENIVTLIATPGGVTAANTAALNRVLASFPDAKVQTEKQFIDSQEATIDSELNLLYILLALSIVVSLFGIVITLVLTVFERTRELGMLRAIGMTRRQARRMIRHEAIITALIGATHAQSQGRHRASRRCSRPRPPRHPLLRPVGDDRHLRARGDPRRHPRRDLPGTAGIPTQHPERPPVRVGPRRARLSRSRSRSGSRVSGGE